MIVFFVAFMAEHHRMAAVITGLGHCFEMVNKECKSCKASGNNLIIIM